MAFNSTYLAPNGQPSNLTPEQWRLVRTPEFKAWFGDWENAPNNASKIIDENGEPLVMFSGSPNKFTVFKTEEGETDRYDREYKPRHWFILDKTWAENYSKKRSTTTQTVYEVFLNVRKPKPDFNLYADEDYDGSVEFRNKKVWVAIATTSNQIKLADGSNTTFDADSPDIRFKNGGQTELLLAPNGQPSNLTPEQWRLVRAPEFKAWFGDWENDPENSSKVVDSNGEPLVMYHGTPYGKFNIFDKNLIGKNYKEQPFGFYFTNIKTPEQLRGYSAEEYSKKGKTPHIFEVFLNLKNPIEQDVFSERPAEAIDWEHTDLRNQIKKSVINSFKKGFKKYDGVTAKSSRTKELIAVALKSNQIKLADGTNTTFDDNNPDIRFENGGQTELLLAPNGKPSNLTPEQYHLVRTPEFKAWFGDWENSPETSSKVVDENGEPLVVYHGTNLEFNEFDYSETQKNDVGFVGKGFYFTPKESLALAYAERQHDRTIWSWGDNEEKNKSKVIVKSFFLSIKNAKVVNEPEDIGINYYKSEIGDKLEKEKIVKISDNLKKQGYQGVIWHRDNCNGCLNGRKHWEYVAFEPNQIKLADGTNTTFDDNNPDIRFENGGQTEFLLAPNGEPSNLTPEQYRLVRTPEFKAWFGDWFNSPETASKVVDSNGEPLVCYHGTKYTNEYYNFDLDTIDESKVKAFFFSSGYAHAKRYTYNVGYIREFFINIRKLFDPKNLSKQEVKSILSILNEKLVVELNNYNEDNSFFDELKKEYGIYDMPTNIALFHILTKTTSSWQIIEQPSFQNYLIEKRYEGFKTSEQSTLIKKDNENFAVYSPKNIKLADGTNTTFDSNNPDIRFENGGKTDYSNYKTSVIALEYRKKILILQRGSTAPWMPNKWSLVGGVVDEGENPTDAIIRECFEEIGLNPIDVLFSHKIMTPDSGEIYYFTGKLPSAKVTLDYENSAYHFITKNEVENYEFVPHVKEFLLNVFSTQKSVNKKYAIGGQTDILLAPNGKPSNLTPEQYRLVRSPEFKAWFGDWENSPETASKVVDEETKEPLVVWHGSKSNENFNVFKQSSRFEFIYFAKTKYYSWFHFTQDIEDKPFQLKPFFLNIRNLLNAEEFGFENINYSDLKSFFYGIHDLDKDIQILPYKKSYLRFWQILRYSNDLFDSLKQQDYYNGISFYENMYESTTWKNTDDFSLSYVVMNPNQIKLADGTNTTFDSNNSDIRFAKGGRTISQTPSPTKDRVYGSQVNPKKSSSNLLSASKIEFSAETTKTIKDKVEKHNAEYPNKEITVESAKAVVRRGMGAYSKSHRPTISGGKPNSRVAWGLARLNAFIYKILNGKSKSGKYKQDDDLISELGYKVSRFDNGGKTDIPTRFFGSQAGGVLIYCKTTNRVLLLLRSPFVLEPFTWGTISGKVEGDEQIEETVKREAYEETGFELKTLYPSYVFERPNFKFFNFISIVEQEFEPQLDWENIDYLWTSLDNLPDNLHFGLVELLKQKKFKRL